jgi:DNA invertase Pin-like site-specific DNA recombinase
MPIGYARVSTRDQYLALHLDALTKVGCDTIYQEKVSGASTSRSSSGRLALAPPDTIS